MSFNNNSNSIPNQNDQSPTPIHHQLNNYFNEIPSPTLSSDSSGNTINTQQQFILNIRFPHSSETHQCLLKSGSNTLISELLQIIREQCIEKDNLLRSNENYSPSKSILKLIHHGRLLTPFTLPISKFNIQSENFIHCTFSPIIPHQTNSTLQQNNSDHRHGFDALLNVGLAREEVNEVRRQFYASHSNLLELHRRGQLSQRDLFDIEQQWMQNDATGGESAATDNPASLRPTLAADVNNIGNIYHFFCGVFLGFFLGFVSLIALLENSLSRRFQFGIRCGVATMIILSIFKYYFPTLLPYML